MTGDELARSSPTRKKAQPWPEREIRQGFLCEVKAIGDASVKNCYGQAIRQRVTHLEQARFRICIAAQTISFATDLARTRGPVHDG